MMKNYDQSVKINHNPNWPYLLMNEKRYKLEILKIQKHSLIIHKQFRFMKI